MISGIVESTETFKTKKELSAINLRLNVSNRYTDIIPCVAYGSLAELIYSKIKPGSNVIVFGRMMSTLSKESAAISLRIVIEKIAEELIVPLQKNSDGTTK